MLIDYVNTRNKTKKETNKMRGRWEGGGEEWGERNTKLSSRGEKKRKEKRVRIIHEKDKRTFSK